MPIKIVIIIGVTFIVGIIGLDIWWAVDDRPGNTWSEIIRVWGRATPLVPWACGVLSGHFFHPVDGLAPLFGQPTSVAVLIWLTWGVGVAGLALSGSGHPVPPWAAFLPAMVVGAALWPV